MARVNLMETTMKTVIASAFAAALLAVSSFAYADDATKTKNSGTDTGTTITDDATTGSVKCDNSNANVNSGCDKPGHLKQGEKMQQDQQ